MKRCGRLPQLGRHYGFAPHAGRGLKRVNAADRKPVHCFAPHAGRGLKRVLQTVGGISWLGFAPHAGRGLKREGFEDNQLEYMVSPRTRGAD